MNKFRRFLLISILTFLASPIFADNWYVCLSSFTKKSNAEHLIQQMEKNDLKGCIEVSCTKGTIYFRVLLEEPFATVQEARDRRDQMKNDNFVKAYGLKGLWPCKANPENFIYVCPKGDAYSSKPEAATVSEDSVSKADVAAVTEEVVTIDEATATAIAENPAVAAANSEIEAAATTEPVANETEEVAPSAEQTEPAAQEEAAESAEQTEPVAQEEAAESAEQTEPKLKPEVSDVINEVNLRCMKMVPQADGYGIDLFYLFDFDNIRENGVSVPQLAKLEPYIDDASFIHTAAFARYVNEEGRYVDFYAAVGSKNSFGYLELSGAPVRYSVEGEDLDSFIYTDGENYFFVGTDKYREIMIQMSAYGYTREEMKEFLKQILKDTTVENYEEIPAQFNLLPKTKSNIQRSFQSFCLEKIGDEYINARDGKEWAQALRGCYNSKSTFISDDYEIILSLFNLPSEDAAITQQNYYIEEQKLNEVDETNRASKGWNGTAWFKSNFEENGKQGKELTFAKNNFWVAAKTYSSATEDDLQDFCFDLQLY